MTALTIARRTAALGLAAVALSLSACGGGGAGGGTVGASGDDMTMGSPSAPVKVIEYASTSCPHCALYEKNDFPALKSKYIDTGKIYYIFRETPIHEQLDVPAFLLARCLPREKYFEVIRQMMEGQKEYIELRSEDQFYKAYRGMLYRIAKEQGGMDQQAAVACMSDQAKEKKLQERTDAQKTEFGGVDSTPTFIVNGVKVEQIGGKEMSNDMVFPAIERALNKKG
jgi:protein-disulfide isomerase